MKTSSALLSLLLVLGLAPAFTSIHAEGGLGLGADIKAHVELERENHGEATTSTTTGIRKDNLGREIKEIKGDLKTEVHTDRMAFRSEVARASIKMAGQIFSATITRLDRIIDRIESRVAKVSAAGGATAETQADVDAAKANIADAQIQVTAFTAVDLTSTTSTTTLAANFQTAKAAAQKARQDLQSARQNLIKAVQALMKVEKGLKVTASTTVSVH